MFWGIYAEETESKLNELHEKLLGAGLNRVLEEMNRQLDNE